MIRNVILSLLFISTLQASKIPHLFTVGMGAFELYREKNRALEVDLQCKFHFDCLKSPFHFLEFRPLLGVMATPKGNGYLCGGINFDLLFFKHILFAPGFAAGYYWQGSGKNLGYPIEFRTSVELAWQFNSWHRLGCQFYHLSNASISKKNPGEESLIVFYDIPIKKGFPFSN